MIGAHSAELNGTILGTGVAPTEIGCPHEGSGVCSYTNPSQTSDVWVATSFGADSGNGTTTSLMCTTNGVTVCSWGLNQSTGAAGGSCGFFVSGGATVKCVVKGMLGKVTSHVQALSVRVLAPASSMAASPASHTQHTTTVTTVSPSRIDTADVIDVKSNSSTCPMITGASGKTMCDCGVANTDTTDFAVSVHATSNDDGFNSFHCFIDGANVCAWGSNLRNRNNAGGCYFVVPAGSMYNCSMEWGATCILETTVIPLRSALFPQRALLEPNANTLKKVSACCTRSFLTHLLPKALRWFSQRHLVSVAVLVYNMYPLVYVLALNGCATTTRDTHASDRNPHHSLHTCIT